MEIQSRKRQLNIEILRIFSMLLITLWHVKIHFMEGLNLESSINKSFMDYVIMFIPFHVDLFILITGFFGVRNFKSGMVKTLLLVYFYSIILNVVSWMITGNFSLTNALFPISQKMWWFMTMYTVMLMIAPVIENYVSVCSRKAIWTIGICALLVDLYLGHYQHVDGIYDRGGGMTNFVCVYLLGVWIRKEGVYLLRVR